MKASAPPANESGIDPSKASPIRAARLTVTAWRARPERYIVGSRSNTPRQLRTSSVFDSFSPKATPRAGGGRAQPREHRHGVVPAEVVTEGLVGDRDVAVPELVVHDPADPLRARAASGCTSPSCAGPAPR